MSGEPLPRQSAPPVDENSVKSQPYDAAFYASVLTPPPPPIPQDAPHKEEIHFYLDVYDIQTPLGSISQRDDFWKQADENALDVSTYDTLFRNGVRVGVASAVQWDELKSIITQANSRVERKSMVGQKGNNSELLMRENIPYQTIFQFSPENGLVGRTYENCQNLLTVAFEPTPRRFGSARVNVCPLVRGLRKRLGYVDNGDSQDIEYVSPERLYDVNLRVDIPFGHFLIMAPSTEARLQTTIGNRFLVSDGTTSPTERVLIIVPHPYRLEQVPTPSRPAANPASPAKHQ